jgi:hypothetical protein
LNDLKIVFIKDVVSNAMTAKTMRRIKTQHQPTHPFSTADVVEFILKFSRVFGIGSKSNTDGSDDIACAVPLTTFL